MIDKQLPDGIEWPRFEDGELVQYRDKIMHEGRPETVQAFYFNRPGHVILSLFGVDHEKLHHLSDGATVQRPPVLDKDGQEIKVGDTVYNVVSGEGSEVKAIEWDRVGAIIRTTTSNYFGPSDLTHTPLDSWEKLREDAQKLSSSYWGCAGMSCENCPAKIEGELPADHYGVYSCIIAEQMDILARAEKLAGVSADV